VNDSNGSFSASRVGPANLRYAAIAEVKMLRAADGLTDQSCHVQSRRPTHDTVPKADRTVEQSILPIRRAQSASQRRRCQIDLVAAVGRCRAVDRGDYCPPSPPLIEAAAFSTLSARLGDGLAYSNGGKALMTDLVAPGNKNWPSRCASCATGMATW